MRLFPNYFGQGLFSSCCYFYVWFQVYNDYWYQCPLANIDYVVPMTLVTLIHSSQATLIHTASRVTTDVTKIRTELHQKKQASKRNRMSSNYKETRDKIFKLKKNTHRSTLKYVKYSNRIWHSQHASHCYGNSHAIWDHTVLAATHQRWHSRLYPSQLTLTLDLVTPKRYQAELT